MNKQLRVAAVVVTYNRWALLQQCLRALSEQTTPLAAIWVIDNASTDGTGEAIRKLELPNLIYRNTGHNLGGAGGFAYGTREAALAGYDALWLFLHQEGETAPSGIIVVMKLCRACMDGCPAVLWRRTERTSP